MRRVKLCPPGLEVLRLNVLRSGNVANFPNSERAMWAEFMPSPPKGLMKRRAEVVYFVGCMASFSPQVQDIPAALVQLMEKAEVDFTILGEQEHCCGYPLLAGGMDEEVERLIEHNTRAIERTGASRVVFSCPSCYRTFREVYALDAEVVHHTQFLLELVEEGRLCPRKLELTAVYHDPCDLGRHSGVYEEPRRLVRRFCTLRELPRAKEVAPCCGGGGDVETVNPELVERISRSAVAEAAGAGVVVTACQQCKRVLRRGARDAGLGVEVRDVAEVMLEALER